MVHSLDVQLTPSNALQTLQVWTMDVGWDFDGVNENLDVMSCRELLSYLTADLKFPADEMKELESKLISTCIVSV